ncbi:MAG: hypothetical protein C9356_09215 [Oleiphilus sp.]|nr:MAG: hypothetical protein C9356_09215 [Oleiphilus sp.]
MPASLYNVQSTKEYLKSLEEALEAFAYTGGLDTRTQMTVYEWIKKLKQCNSRLQKKPEKSNFSVSFSPNLEIPVVLSKASRYYQLYVCLGGNIEIVEGRLNRNNTVLSFLLEAHEDFTPSIANSLHSVEYKKGKHILRKFHFDWDEKCKSIGRPVSHLQYGGKPNSGFLPGDSSQASYLLLSTLDNPRLEVLPQDLGITLHRTLSEQDSKLASLVHENGWKKGIIKIENTLVAPFVANLHKYLSATGRTHTSEFFFKDPAS